MPYARFSSSQVLIVKADLLNLKPILVLACELGYATLVEVVVLTDGADVNVDGVVPRNYISVPDDEASPLSPHCMRERLRTSRANPAGARCDSYV